MEREVWVEGQSRAEGPWKHRPREDSAGKLRVGVRRLVCPQGRCISRYHGGLQSTWKGREGMSCWGRGGF